MKRCLSFFIALFAAGVLAGCGGDSEPSDAQEAKTVIEAEAQADADAIVLKLNDLPSGWRADTSEDDDEGPECVDFDFSDLTVNGRAESPDFTRGESTSVSSFAAVFQSEEQAQTAYERLASRELADCFVDFFKEQSDEEARVTDAEAGELSFPDFGDQSSAWQFVIEIEPRGAEGFNVSAFLDLVFIQQKRLLAGVFFVDVLSPFPNEEKEGLASIVGERVEGAAS